MRRRKFAYTVSASMLSVSLAGCADDEPADEDTGESLEEPEDEELEPEEDEPEEDEPSLEIVEHELVEDDFSVEVQGIVINNSDEEESYVAVEVVFYDEDGVRIDDSFTNTSDLGPGEEWSFSVLTTQEAGDIDEYDISVTDSAF